MQQRDEHTSNCTILYQVGKLIEYICNQTTLCHNE